MVPKVIEGRHVEGYRLWLRFEDGLEGEIDLSDILQGPVFAPLKDVSAFARLRVDPNWHTIVWPGDLDIAPESLRTRLEAALAEGHAAE